MHNRLDWDDLRMFLAVAREGSLSGAARTLSVNHSTVFRRLNGLEARLDVRLFDRQPGGYGLTSAGEALLESSDRVEAEILSAERALRGRDLRLRGGLRVTMPDTIARLMLPALIAPFERRYPEIELELVVSDTFLNLGKRDADIALRPTNTPPETLIGRRVSGIATAIYRHVDADAPAAALSRCRWIAPDDSLAHLASARWLRDLAPPVAIRANTMSGMLDAARAGMGLAVLPCFLGDPEPALRRVRDPVAEFETGLWALTHRDLRQTARIRAFLDAMAPIATGLRPLLEGGRPAHRPAPIA